MVKNTGLFNVRNYWSKYCIMKKIRERILFMGFSNEQTIEINNYIVIMNNDYQVLSQISDECMVVVLINVNMSSHFMNVVRQRLNRKKYSYILGGNQLYSLLKEQPKFSIIKPEFTICIDYVKYIFQSFDSYENLKYDMDLNLSTGAYCMRPDKRYGKEYLKIMKNALQNFHGRTCFIENNQMWYMGGMLPSELFTWCDQNFEEYLGELKKSLRVFYDIFAGNGSSLSESNILLCEYYKYTDYIGILVDVVNYKIWDMFSAERIFILQSFSSGIFTINDNTEKAINILTLLTSKLQNEVSLKAFCEAFCELDLNRIEYWFIILNVLSDIRRKAIQNLREQSDYINNISKWR